METTLVVSTSDKVEILETTLVISISGKGGNDQ